MAYFTNRASLSYNGVTTVSNVVTGQIITALTATKTALGGTYSVGGRVTYAVGIVNSGGTALTGLTLTDDLGAYRDGAAARYPLSYTAGSALYLVDGVPQAAPSVTAGPPLTVSGISVPANGSAVLIYETLVTDSAPPQSGGTIVNEAVIRGDGLTIPITASETVTAAVGPRLTITKELTPIVVSERERITYTFTIRNYGNAPATADDLVTITDTFSPPLSALAVTYDGAPWASPANYAYNAATGEFATVPGRITVPAAQFTLDACGTWTTVPGVRTITVTGTI